MTVISRYTPVLFPVNGNAPENTQQASISQPASGSESEVDEGEWSGTPVISFEYQWQLDGVDIIGATSKTILVLAGMVGSLLRCIVKGVNSFGFATSITVALVVTL